ncbi:MAG TPA: HPF/RaiA family ribosome-associated protein [Candidatus Peribacterales bacterium]|nr:HPF/RaiA family ribosome-associated protein [Candidatus Peribacterales bacterium]
MPINVTHLEKGYSYTEKERMMVAKKVGRLSRYSAKMQDESSEIRVETVSRDTKKERDSVKVMITVTLPKKVLRAESRKSKALDAVDSCCEKLESQIEKYKDAHGSPTKVTRKARRSKR